MAMTKEQHETILKLIAEQMEEPTDEMLDYIQQLRDDYDERLTIEEGSGGEWQGKYNDLKARYLKRFFSPQTSPDEIDEEMGKDVKRDGTEQTFDELFERKEG